MNSPFGKSRFVEADAIGSDDPLVVATQKFQADLSTFLGALAAAPGMDQRYPFASTSLAAAPALCDQLIDELDPVAGIEPVPGATREASRRLYKPRCIESATVADRAGSTRICSVTSAPIVKLVRESATSVPTRARIVVIRVGPGNLADRHLYTESALQNAVRTGLFEGAQSFIDHPGPASEAEHPGRSVRDLCGQLSNVAMGTFNDPQLGQVPAVLADFVPTSTAAGELAFGLIKSAVAQREAGIAAPLLGFSINAYGIGEPTTIDGEPWNQVDELTEVVSVDVVTKAGAGGGVLAMLESARQRPNRFAALANEMRAAGILKPRKPYAPICSDARRGSHYFAGKPLREALRGAALYAPKCLD